MLQNDEVVLLNTKFRIYFKFRKTFRSRIDRFGVAQPNIQKLETADVF